MKSNIFSLCSSFISYWTPLRALTIISLLLESFCDYWRRKSYIITYRMCSIARSLVVLNSTMVVSWVSGSTSTKSMNPMISLSSTCF